jgi:hypothetical protein
MLAPPPALSAHPVSLSLPHAPLIPPSRSAPNVPPLPNNLQPHNPSSFRPHPFTVPIVLIFTRNRTSTHLPVPSPFTHPLPNNLQSHNPSSFHLQTLTVHSVRIFTRNRQSTQFVPPFVTPFPSFPLRSFATQHRSTLSSSLSLTLSSFTIAIAPKCHSLLFVSIVISYCSVSHIQA